MDTATFIPTRTPEPVLGARTIGLDATSQFEIATHIRSGLPTSSIHTFARELDRSSKYVLAITSIPESTFHNYQKARKRLPADASSRVYQIAKAVEAAVEFFEGDKEAALRWLTTAKVALGGEAPIAFASTPEGSEYVVRLLGRMEHGVIS